MYFVNKFKTKPFLYGYLILFIYFLFYLLKPIGIILGKGNANLANSITFLCCVFLLLILIVIYTLISRSIQEKSNIKPLLWFFLCFNLILLPLKPITSSDLNAYIYQSRVYSSYSANPFTSSFAEFPDDPLYPKLANNWSNRPSPYGPLFIFVSGCLNKLGNNNLPITIYLFKLLMMLANIITAWMIYKLTKNARSFFFFAWNPLVLFEFALNAHNDILVIALILGSLTLFQSAHYEWQKIFAFALAIFSLLIKPITIFIVPLILLYFIFSYSKPLHKFYFAASSLFLTLFLVFISYYTFWEGFATLTRLINQAGQTDWLFISPLIFFFSFFLYYFGTTNYLFVSALTGRILFGLIYIALIIKTFIFKQRFDERTFFLFMLTVYTVMLGTFFHWLMPWYLALWIALATLYLPYSKYNHYDKLIIGASVYGTLFYILLR